MLRNLSDIYEIRHKRRNFFRTMGTNNFILCIPFSDIIESDISEFYCNMDWTFPTWSFPNPSKNTAVKKQIFSDNSCSNREEANEMKWKKPYVLSETIWDSCAVVTGALFSGKFYVDTHLSIRGALRSVVCRSAVHLEQVSFPAHTYNTHSYIISRLRTDAALLLNAASSEKWSRNNSRYHLDPRRPQRLLNG